MANFPTSLDTLTNPTSGNTLDNPSHSLQHSDANDILEALEAKVGIGLSTAGSATTGHALVASTGGTTSWTTIGTAGISSGAATNGQVLTANGSSGVSFTTLPTSGLVLLNTTSFSGVASISVNDVFSSTYRVYRILLNVSSGSGSLSIRLRASGADNTSSVYNNAAYFWRSGGAGGDLATDENVNQAYLVDAISNGTFTSMDLYNPNVNSETNGNFTGNHISGSVGYITMSHWGSIRHNTSYQATGFTYIFGSTGTGTVQVYGYNQ